MLIRWYIQINMGKGASRAELAKAAEAVRVLKGTRREDEREEEKKEEEKTAEEEKNKKG